MGHKCDQCNAGYFNFPDCVPCNCNLAGTKLNECRGPNCFCSNEGQCKCKVNNTIKLFYLLKFTKNFRNTLLDLSVINVLKILSVWKLKIQTVVQNVSALIVQPLVLRAILFGAKYMHLIVKFNLKHHLNIILDVIIFISYVKRLLITIVIQLITLLYIG